MAEQINRYAARIHRLFNHGNLSYHLAKLLEESGELSAAVTKSQGEEAVCDEVADVVLSALVIGVASCGHKDFDEIIERKLSALENDPNYQNFKPPQ
tara:strand:- start:109 stop:399 length:291 start_codon:yes stop_codon:yes gene_type:complete